MADIHDVYGLKRQSTAYIGIDPDRERSGVAFCRANSGMIEELKTLAFFELMEYLKEKKEMESELVVVVESGNKIQGNWHINDSDSARKAARIGGYVGANHAIGEKIVEMCKYLSIFCVEKIPSRKKLNSETFKMYTRWNGRTNQEMRDAAMLVFGL